MSEALVGFIGVAAGALTTGGVDALARWQVRRLSARGAARMIHWDLVWANEVILDAIESAPPQWWPDDLALGTEAWDKYREELARSAISGKDYGTLHAAFLHIDDFERDRRAGVDFPKVTDAVAAGVIEIAKAGDTALRLSEGRWERLRRYPGRRLAWRRERKVAG